MYTRIDELQATRRSQLLSEPNCRFVTHEEYCSMLLSRSTLSRIYDFEAMLVGLQNVETGDRFYIEIEKLAIVR